jgi:hypothetical protein
MSPTKGAWMVATYPKTLDFEVGKRESKIVEMIVAREAVLHRVQRWAEESVALEAAENLGEVEGVLKQLRSGTVSVVDAVCRWREVIKSPDTFWWQGVDYLQKMGTDSEFVGNIKGFCDALGGGSEGGFSTIDNPCLIPPSYTKDSAPEETTIKWGAEPERFIFGDLELRRIHAAVEVIQLAQHVGSPAGREIFRARHTGNNSSQSVSITKLDDSSGLSKTRSKCAVSSGTGDYLRSLKSKCTGQHARNEEIQLQLIHLQAAMGVGARSKSADKSTSQKRRGLMAGTSVPHGMSKKKEVWGSSRTLQAPPSPGSRLCAKEDEKMHGRIDKAKPQSIEERMKVLKVNLGLGKLELRENKRRYARQMTTFKTKEAIAKKHRISAAKVQREMAAQVLQKSARGFTCRNEMHGMAAKRKGVQQKQKQQEMEIEQEQPLMQPLVQTGDHKAVPTPEQKEKNLCGTNEKAKVAQVKKEKANKANKAPRSKPAADEMGDTADWWTGGKWSYHNGELVQSHTLLKGSSSWRPMLGSRRCSSGVHEWVVKCGGAKSGGKFVLGVAHEEVDVALRMHSNLACWGVYLSDRDMDFSGKRVERMGGPDQFDAPCEAKVRLDCDAGTLSMQIGSTDLGVVCSTLPRDKALHLAVCSGASSCELELVSYASSGGKEAAAAAATTFAATGGKPLEGQSPEKHAPHPRRGRHVSLATGKKMDRVAQRDKQPEQVTTADLRVSSQPSPQRIVLAPVLASGQPPQEEQQRPGIRAWSPPAHVIAGVEEELPVTDDCSNFDTEEDYLTLPLPEIPSVKVHAFLKAINLDLVALYPDVPAETLLSGALLVQYTDEGLRDLGIKLRLHRSKLLREVRKRGAGIQNGRGGGLK